MPGKVVFGYQSTKVTLADYEQVFVAATGSVFVASDFGIQATGSGNTVNVLGSVFAGDSAIQMGDDPATDHNNQLFIGETGYINGSSIHAAVSIQGFNSTVENEGTIWNKNSSGYGIRIEGKYTNSLSQVINSGTIDVRSYGIFIADSEKIHIENSGLIKSGNFAIVGGAGALDVKNTGAISGDVTLSATDDIFDTRSGTLAGFINAGSGNDTLYGSKGDDYFYGGDGKDKLYGYDGNDTLYGHNDNDTLSGGNGDDILYGGAGSDIIYGDAGGDRIEGNDGNDKIYGGTGNDRLSGDQGSDTLMGGLGDDAFFGGSESDRLYGEDGDDYLAGDAGADTLYGGDGKDYIIGGEGVDRLFGGADADVFTFNVNETGATKATADTIFDFQTVDDIDLSGIEANTKASGSQTFSFIGTQGFHGKAGELRFEKAASDTWIYGDTNGDKKADFIIHLDDAITLSKANFILEQQLAT